MKNMRVLWVMFAPIGTAAELFGYGAPQSGKWIDATAELLLKERDDIELGVAFPASDSREKSKNGIRYFGVPNVKNLVGKRPPRRETASWAKVISKFSPDIIMVWGSESGCGLSVIEAARGIPVLFYIQGMPGALKMYPLGRIPLKEYKKEVHGIERAKIVFDRRNQKGLERQADIEKEIAVKSAGVIGDNGWCEAYYKFLDPSIRFYRHPLAMNGVFGNVQYEPSHDEKTIFTIAGTGPHKGLHILIKALKNVAEVYPDIKLYIPGSMTYRKPELIFRPMYVAYLNGLIKRSGLQKNVIFCGRLSSEEMAEKIKRCSVFVMPSCIENHSSSLREAMLVGAPCVSSMVGSVHEFIEHGKNGLLYRYEEPWQLARHILDLLRDLEFAKTLGQNASDTIRRIYSDDGSGSRLYEIYKEAVEAANNIHTG